MIKPPSIARFEQFWWASTVFWLIGIAIAWGRTQAMLAANAQTAVAAPWVQSLTIAIVLLYTTAMWFLVARRGSVVAKWVVVVLTGLAVLRLFSFIVSLMHPHAPVMSSVVFIIATLLSVAAVVMLFRPDARMWFGEGDLQEPVI